MHTDKTIDNRVQRQRAAHPAEFSGVDETRFQISGPFRGDLYPMDQGPRREFIPGKFAEEEVRLHRAKPAEDPGKFKGFNRSGPEHIHGLSIVAQCQRPTHAASPPKALLTKGQIPSTNVS